MQNFINEFTLNFIDDSRYRYIIEGFVNTMIISLFAVLVGIAIGFLVAIIRSSHDKTGYMKVGNFICRIYLTVMRGTPTMIQLLIIYYVIFASVNIPKIFVRSKSVV